VTKTYLVKTQEELTAREVTHINSSFDANSGAGKNLKQLRLTQIGKRSSARFCIFAARKPLPKRGESRPPLSGDHWAVLTDIGHGKNVKHNFHNFFQS
jgi:hypothetical protein